MPKAEGPGEERILLARQSAEAMLEFLRRLDAGEVDLHEAKHELGLLAFSDAERDALLEVLQRNAEIEGQPIIVVRGEDGKLHARPFVAAPR